MRFDDSCLYIVRKISIEASMRSHTIMWQLSLTDLLPTRKMKREKKRRAIIIYINGLRETDEEGGERKKGLVLRSVNSFNFLWKHQSLTVPLVGHKSPWINSTVPRDADARSSCTSVTRLKYRSDNLMLHRSLILHPSINALLAARARRVHFRAGFLFPRQF